MEELIAGKKKLRLSYLYGRLMDGKISNEERFLLARILKDIAIRKEIVAPFVVFGETCYVDLEEKEPRNNF